MSALTGSSVVIEVSVCASVGGRGEGVCAWVGLCPVSACRLACYR